MNKVIVIVFFCFIGLSCSRETSPGQFVTDPVQYVNPFIGTDGHGHTFPGASMPFGMVQLSPDTRLEGWDGCSGYHFSDSVIFGFSHTHLSGTGIPDYCDILFMPTSGRVILDNGYNNPEAGYASAFKHEKEVAEAGYYKVHLEDYNIDAEFTTTRRVGFHRYTFLGYDTANIVVDLVHRDKVLDSWIHVTSENTIEGYRQSSSWANDQRVYFAAAFSVPFISYGLTLDERKLVGDFIQGKQVKAFFRFSSNAGEEILVKVGISAVSAEGARKNLQAEIPNWNFDQIRMAARNTWNEELGRIQVSGGSEEKKTVFYTALYHAYLVPNLYQDVDGQFLGRDFTIQQADSFSNYTVFSLWDTFRAAHPLYVLTQPQRTVDFMRTMLAQYDLGGRLPVWELAANETECMIGYHAIPVIADAWVKGIRDFDVEKAYHAMKHSVELDHFGLASYKKYGFIPAEDEAESVSRTLEYAYDDWCIAVVAEELGYEEDYRNYLRRAQSYKNLFDPSTGFMRARMNGRWFEPFDPREVNFNYTEANSWQYSFFVPQDVSGLMTLLGGADAMTDRLDQLFTESEETTGRQQSDITGLIGQYAHGNEPSHHMAYLYNYSGQPWKTQERTRQILDELYSARPDGLCGNEDCGQMSAWYVFSAMGFYPVTHGDPVYAIGSPLFDAVRINFENGKSFTLRAINNSPQNKYIQSTALNGISHPASFISHSAISFGGILEFQMGPEPNPEWGTGPGNVPVSSITDHLIIPVPFVQEGSRTFTDQTTLELGCIDTNLVIHYTLDGSDPSLQSDVYDTPIVIDRSVTLQAVASRNAMVSQRLTAEFNKIPVGRSIRLNTRYSNQYAAGGELALIDFIRGPLNFRTGSWQGYEGINLDAVIDLGSIQLITQIETGFLQDIRAWIFMPEKVEYSVSMDGHIFQPVETIVNEVYPKDESVQIKNFTSDISMKARYIHIIARNRGVCPDWHWGAGNKAWIFADEIVIH